MIRFLWLASRGYRLRPWASPYLRWRIETYQGWAASGIRPGDFLGFVRWRWKELLRFLRWAGRMSG